MKKLYVPIFLFLITSQIFGGGFQINEHGARAMGMGGAYTAISNDASSIYWNPAGLTQISGTQFMLGTSLIAPSSSFEGITPANKKFQTENQLFFPTHFFGAHNFDNGLVVGLGFTSPFGLGVKWADDWAGRFLALDTELKVFKISPAVAYKLTDQFSISAGFIYSWADVTIKQKTPKPALLGGGESLITLDGKDNAAFGFNIGLLYKPMPDLSFGASFHSQLKYNFSGTATSSNVPSAAAALFPHGNISAELTAPYNLAAGVAYRVVPKLLLSFDFQYIGWSSYDTLRIDFASYKDNASPRLYDNSFILRLGGEYGINDDLAVLAGAYFDKSPVKKDYMSPSLPEGNRLGLSAGLEYTLTGNLKLAASYLFIHSSEVNVTNSTQDYIPGDAAVEQFNGIYNSTANLVSITLMYSL